MNDSVLERLRNFKRQQRDFERLENNEFRRLENACDSVEDELGRHEQISELLEYVANADLNERKSERFHDRILNGPEVKAIANIGPRDDKVDPDEEFREWLAKESLKPLPDDSKEQILNNLNELTGLFEPDDSKKQKRLYDLEKIRSELAKHLEQKAGRVLNAKATRALAVLFPRDFTTLSSEKELGKFIKDFNKSYIALGIDSQGSVPYKHRQILERLDEFLESSPEDNLELARRMTLPFRLMEQGYLMPEPLSTDDSEEMIAPQNIILYGPPGTGKTYSTTQRALELILGKGANDGDVKDLFRKYQKKGQIEFVTFHQSYGYEEFVEGLWPVLDDTESADVRYELHDGVFKRIALRAAAEGLQKSAEGADFDDLWDQLVAKIEDHSDRIFKGKGRGKGQPGKEYVLEVSEKNNIIAYAVKGDGKNNDNVTRTGTKYTASKENSKKLWDQRIKFGFGEDPEHLTSENAKEILGNCDYPGLWIVYKRLLELSHDESAHIGEERPSNDAVQRALDKGESESFSFSPETPQYVLIIDEINRGNISKVLGELITLLEPDKRLGADNELRLRLPYSPAHRFGVPPNLHILGTMNTADRSIALMDVALRRRFTFEERMPDAHVLRVELNLKLRDNEPLVTLIVDLFNALNKRIRFLYDRDHQLGHSYFLNVNSLEDLRRVFIDRVIPLLQEYFYGDWYKICTVLGCPYSEDGDKRSGNDHPIVEAEKFGEVDTLGFDHDEYEDRMDFAVSADFLRGDKELVHTFLGVLQLKDEELKTRLRKLTDNGSSSDKEEGGKERSEDNQ